MLNVPAYLDRIAYAGPTNPSPETLRALHRAHMLAVPFENLDIHLGRPIICDEARFLHKIIDERRGGFCYELNGAFAALLRALGFQVTLLSARVTRADGGDGPEFDHLTLRVDLPAARADGPRSDTSCSDVAHSDVPGSGVPYSGASCSDAPWLADVGFGDSFLEPLCFEPDLEQPQIGRVYRLMEIENKIHLEVKAGDTWKRQYSFSLQPRQLGDFAAMCHYHQTSPESHFTRQRICSRATPRGRISLSGMKVIETRDGWREERELEGEHQWRTTLRELFQVDLPA